MNLAKFAMLAGLGPLLLTSCYRETTTYDVGIYGQGTHLDEVMPSAEPMGGLVEISRVRLWGSNLGMGAYGGFDSPWSDGLQFVYPNAAFGYPANRGWSRGSFHAPPAPDLGDLPVACATLIDVNIEPAPLGEYVDVGDALWLTADDGTALQLPRNPAAHPRPAGASWFVGYGGKALPYVDRSHALLSPTWFAGETVGLTFAGTVQAPEASIGAIPMPGQGTFRYPAPLTGVSVNGVALRAPHNGYDDAGVWVGSDVLDDVRSIGPWADGGTVIEWDADDAGDQLVISLRYLGSEAESACNGCMSCDPGFTCVSENEADPNAEQWCTPVEGSSTKPLGEVSCSVPDTGSFTLEYAHISTLAMNLSSKQVDGALLTISRRTEGELPVADVLSFNGKRIPITPVRTRATDMIITRLDVPPPLNAAVDPDAEQ